LIGTIPLQPAPSAPIASSSPHVSQSTNEDMILESNMPSASYPSSSSMNKFLDGKMLNQ